MVFNDNPVTVSVPGGVSSTKGESADESGASSDIYTEECLLVSRVKHCPVTTKKWSIA